MMVAWTRVGAVEVISSLILYLFLSGGLLEVECKYKKLDTIAQLTLQCSFNCYSLNISIKIFPLAVFIHFVFKKKKRERKRKEIPRLWTQFIF